MILSNMGITKVLIRLWGCADWSGFLLFTNSEGRFSCVEAHISVKFIPYIWRVQWLSGRVLDSKQRGLGLEPQWRHCVVSLIKTH